MGFKERKNVKCLLILFKIPSDEKQHVKSKSYMGYPQNLILNIKVQLNTQAYNRMENTERY